MLAVGVNPELGIGSVIPVQATRIGGATGSEGSAVSMVHATGNIEKVETDPKLTELHLGGLGTSVKQHWDRVPPEGKPFDDENMLIFSTGLLNGTPAFRSSPRVTAIRPPGVNRSRPAASRSRTMVERSSGSG